MPHKASKVPCILSNLSSFFELELLNVYLANNTYRNKRVHGSYRNYNFGQKLISALNS